MKAIVYHKYGSPKPKNTILGTNIAGRVKAPGRNLKQFRPDDEVFERSSFFGGPEYVDANLNH